MSRAVWKFPLPYACTRASQGVEIPKGARVVHFARSEGIPPTIWALVDPEAEREVASFTAYATGETVPAHASHVGSFIDGPSVWHVFDVTRREPAAESLPCGLELPDDQADALRELIEGGACVEVTGGTLERVTVAGARLSTEGMVAAAVLREAGFTVVDA